LTPRALNRGGISIGRMILNLYSFPERERRHDLNIGDKTTQVPLSLVKTPLIFYRTTNITCRRLGHDDRVRSL
jgi:hypothetical protein